MPFSKHPTHNRAYLCLRHVAIGDAFGESFFGQTDIIHEAIAERSIPETSWEFTDDTIMSISVYLNLRAKGGIDPDLLASTFANNYILDPRRGYGATAASMLRNSDFPNQWKVMASAAFDGMGSMGNGAAMRSGPIGAYFFDDLQAVKKNARLSAIVTHANEEAIAGAQAVALATALAVQVGKGKSYSPSQFIEAIITELEDTDTRAKINKSLSVPYSYTIETVRTILGDGTRMLAQDTVPFAIWCAAHNLLSFEEALWKAVSILGDRDTICAIVGGIVGMSATPSTVPALWKESVEAVHKSEFMLN
jgi:ADP-ribosylglycohydrolase